MNFDYKYIYLVPFLSNAFLTAKPVANANITLAYLNALNWILAHPTYFRGWDTEKTIVKHLRTIAYLYTIDAFIDSSCLSPVQSQYIHAISRLGILATGGAILTNHYIHNYVTGFSYCLFTIYLIVTRPCGEDSYAGLGVVAGIMTFLLNMFESPAQHLGFATFLFCMSKSLNLTVDVV
jgi:hypothetical protein